MERNKRKRFLLGIILPLLASCGGSVVSNGYFTDDTLVISTIDKSENELFLLLDKIQDVPTKGIFHYTNVTLEGETDDYNIGDTVQLKVVKIKKETH